MRGLRGNSIHAFQVALAGVGESWACVVSEDGWDVLVVDSRNVNAIPLMRDRPSGTAVVILLAPGEKPWPNCVSLPWPFRPEEVTRVLSSVRGLLRLEDGSGDHRQPVERADKPVAGVRRPALRSLAGLAAHLNDSPRDAALITVGDFEFYIAPQNQRYLSLTHPRALRTYRGSPSVPVHVSQQEWDVVGSMAGVVTGRLDDFLMHLGLHAGAGKLLPWLEEEAGYRLLRWPPLIGIHNRSHLFQLAALIAPKVHTISELVLLSGVAHRDVRDFLNACSLVGCLKMTAESQPAAARSGGRPAAAATPRGAAGRVTTSLLQRIRTRLGLATR